MNRPNRAVPVPIRGLIESTLAGGNATMAKWFLSIRQLPKGAGDSVAELADRIAEYVAEGRLTEADVYLLARTVREFSAKHVYILSAPRAALRRLDLRNAEAYVNSLDDARVRMAVGGPTRNYTFESNDRIRISFSEQHHVVRLVRGVGGPAIAEEQVHRTIVIDAERVTGLVTIAMDPPRGQHPHGPRADDYVGYYHAAAAAILQTELTPLDWRDNLKALQHDRYRAILSLSSERSQDRQGLDLRFSSGSADLRDYTTFQQTTPRISLLKELDGRWESTENADPSDLAHGNALARTLRTEIHASPALVKFAAHTLPEEMTYVLKLVGEAA